MLSELTKTRIEHVIDVHSGRVGIWLYRRTSGRVTHLWGRRAIVLTTRGRRSGLDRPVLVQAFPDSSSLLVVAANSGLRRPPAWCLNLRADPVIDAEFEGRRLHVRSEPLPTEEASQIWRDLILELAPDYAKYERRLGRIPPIFRLRQET